MMLEGKRVVLPGGTSALGLATAKAAMAEGALVVAAAHLCLMGSGFITGMLLSVDGGAVLV